jgi:hypothetical protein
VDIPQGLRQCAGNRDPNIIGAAGSVDQVVVHGLPSRWQGERQQIDIRHPYLLATL